MSKEILYGEDARKALEILSYDLLERLYTDL